MKKSALEASGPVSPAATAAAPRTILITPSAPTPPRRSQTARISSGVSTVRPSGSPISTKSFFVPWYFENRIYASTRPAARRRNAVSSSTIATAPSSFAGNQRIRGSRRNQASCRRASAFVLAIVRRRASSCES